MLICSKRPSPRAKGVLGRYSGVVRAASTCSVPRSDRNDCASQTRWESSLAAARDSLAPKNQYDEHEQRECDPLESSGKRNVNESYVDAVLQLAKNFHRRRHRGDANHGACDRADAAYHQHCDQHEGHIQKEGIDRYRPKQTSVKSATDA